MAWQTLLLALLTFLATARVTRLVTTDTITAPLRAHIASKAADRWYPADESQPDRLTHATEAPRTWRYLHKLVTCPWCSGFWISAAATLAFFRCWLHTWPWDTWPAAFAYAAATFALSHAVGLAHDWLDSPPPIRQIQLLPSHHTVRNDPPTS